MISFDFEYYRPATINEAIDKYNDLKLMGKSVVYYAGGTEIISMARVNSIKFDAVIDIKEIPECRILGVQGNQLIIGAAVSLNEVCEANLFPLLAKAAKSTADHTARNKITIGGNICGKIPYREALLPFLLCDSISVIAGGNGTREASINQVFNKDFRHEDGEFLVQLKTDVSYINLPYVFVKRTKMEQIDYPLVTIASVIKDNIIRTAFSGICAFPFRLKKIEEDINDKADSIDAKVNNIINHIPYPIISDINGSAEYREFILRNILSDLISNNGGAA